ncbi:MAG: hypothetical protein IMZ52_10655 [Actinobacteria bacterium]|nr:hypothetical protein [Actinomycetota bacterium]
MPNSALAISLSPNPVELSKVGTLVTSCDGENEVVYFDMSVSSWEAGVTIFAYSCPPYSFLPNELTHTGTWDFFEVQNFFSYECLIMTPSPDGCRGNPYTIGEVVLEVIDDLPAGPATPSFFTLPVDFATGSIAYVGGLFTDLNTPIYILIGFSLAFLVGDWIVGKFKTKEK